MTNKLSIKGPKHVPILGWRFRGLQMLRDPVKFFNDLQQKHGEYCFWDPKNPKQLCVFGAEMNRYIFSKPDIFIVDAFRESNLPKNSAIERLSFGLMRLNGDDHKRHRKLMQPAFRTSVIDKHCTVIINETKKLISDWDYGQIREIDQDLMGLITKISLRTMFGVSSQDVCSRLTSLIKKLLALATSPFNFILPYNVKGLPYHKMLKIADEIESLIRSLIYEKRKNPGDDVLSILVNSEDAEEGLTEDELISEAYMVLCHETSAAALTWLLLLLDQHPRINQQLLHEIDTIESDNITSLQTLKNLTFLDNVLKESLRLLPPSGFSLRYVSKDHNFNGIHLKEGTMVFLSSYVSHRDPKVYENPLKFDPNRWNSLDVSPYEYFAFGCGAHSCMGKYFAMLEMKIILITILKKFKLSVLPNSIIDRGIRVSMVPKYGLKMKLHRVTDVVLKNTIKGNIYESVIIE